MKANFYDFVKVFALSLLLVSCAFAFFEYVPTSAEWLQSIHPTFNFLINYALQFLILFLPLWFFVVKRYKTSCKDFGFVKTPFWRSVKLILLAYLTYFAFSYALFVLLDATQVSLPGYEAQEPYLPSFGIDWLGLTAASFFIVFIAPIFEEIFFRGFVQQVFVKTWPTWLGLVLTAGLFSLIHFQLGSLIPLFLLGLILSGLYHTTKSIWTPIGFHMLNNLIAFAIEAALIFSGNIAV